MWHDLGEKLFSSQIAKFPGSVALPAKIRRGSGPKNPQKKHKVLPKLFSQKIRSQKSKISMHSTTHFDLLSKNLNLQMQMTRGSQKPGSAHNVGRSAF